MAENRETTVGRFVTAANEVTIGEFWMEHAKGELKARKNHEILRFSSPCWEKKYLNRMFYAGDAIFEAFVQELLNMPTNLLLALYLVYPRYLIKMGPAYMFSTGMRTLRIDGCLTLVLWTHGELTAFHRLMKYGEPSDVCIPGSTRSGMSPLGGACEPDQHSRWDGTQLVQTRRLESSDE